MKIDKKLLQYCLYATGTVLLIYMGITIFNNIRYLISLLSIIIGEIIGIIKPLLMALIIVYLLKPGVKSIENFLYKREIFKRAAFRRVIAISGMYILVTAGFVAIISGIYLMIGGKISNNINISTMIGYLNDYLNNPTSVVSSTITKKLQSSNISMLENLHEKIVQVVSYIQSYFSTSIEVMTASILSIGENIFSFFIAIVLSIYLMQDSEYFMNLWNKIFKLIFGESKSGNILKEILSVINSTFYKYIRGQLVEACFVGVLSAIVLYFIGIDFALIIGIIAGICNMIPYIGPVIGTVLSVIIALQSGQPINALWAIIAMIVIQQVDNSLLAPKIVGASVGLHPVFIMLAIIIGGNVGGLLGMLIAVPVTASLKILLSRWYTFHMKPLN
ncbi:AI-2E family transporter [Clostridium lacusfryxellense]|uniref:AI-2E family transporter n=1 Tax=Clostridium lacusfryxellense TaxID=205328 RepID=UPI001C0B7F6C|nr:AI-2E family transporter [Clostridium lacusfryxellense]MBU3114695.1 AI-2E family transporter [Clostridium lacusfryxellense]